MKRIIIFLALISCVLSLPAQTSDLFQQGNDAYKRADYPAAIEAYTALLDAGYENADLYYNLGNAFYRTEQFGLAILNYERALRLKPHFPEAKQNLQLANARTEDKITPLPEFLLARWFRALVQMLPPNGWHLVLLFLLLLLAASIVFLVASGSYGARKASFICVVVFALLALLATVCTVSATARFNRHNRAVVTQPMAVVKGSPDESGIDKLILHEGTALTIDETLDDWHKVHLADGNSGWLPVAEITII